MRRRAIHAQLAGAQAEPVPLDHALHAFGRVLTRELERTAFYRERVPTLVKQLLVFAFVCLAWVFFRAQSLHDAWLVLSRIVTTGWGDPQFPLLMLVLVLSVWLYQFIYASAGKLTRVLEWSPVRVGMAMAMVAYLLIVAQPGSKAFIYFQF